MKYLFRPQHINYMIAVVAFYVFSLGGCRSNTEEIVIQYPSGELSSRHTEINGKKEGVMTDYYKDGKVKSERMFEADVQTGRSVMYHPNGKIKKVQYFEDGKVHGGDTLFYENGHPEFLRTYNKGVLDGYIRKWDINDSIIYEAKYRNDTLVEVKGEPIKLDTTIQK